jgi:hypothetical protein
MAGRLNVSIYTSDEATDTGLIKLNIIIFFYSSKVRIENNQPLLFISAVIGCMISSQIKKIGDAGANF